jgi:gamma-glutamylcyclotransferase (GGCT)/AIG2-like uncharacterized protein YtfP
MNTKFLAYGSNMSRFQMRDRCPKAKFIKTVTIPGFKFIINSKGVATIIMNSDSTIEGILWELTEACEKSLDHFEGVNEFEYEKKYFNIDEFPDSLVYIATDSVLGQPRSGYLEKIIAAAERENLSQNYIYFLKGQSNG